MKSNAILCSGNELFGVLADLDKRGLKWSSCNTAVGGHNARYELHVNFSGGKTIAPKTPSGTIEKPVNQRRVLRVL